MFGTEAMKIHFSIVTSVFTVQKVHTILLMSVMSECSDLLFTMFVYYKQKSPLNNCAAFLPECIGNFQKLANRILTDDQVDLFELLVG